MAQVAQLKNNNDDARIDALSNKLDDAIQSGDFEKIMDQFNYYCSALSRSMIKQLKMENLELKDKQAQAVVKTANTYQTWGLNMATTLVVLGAVGSVFKPVFGSIFEGCRSLNDGRFQAERVICQYTESVLKQNYDDFSREQQRIIDKLSAIMNTLKQTNNELHDAKIKVGTV